MDLEKAYSVKTPEDSRKLYAEWAATYNDTFIKANDYVYPKTIAQKFNEHISTTDVIKVADIGCGSGGAALLMGSTFPNSVIDGFDISRYALERAEERKLASKNSNVSFFDPRDTPIANDHSYDLICTFDCIHDMTHPTEMMRTIRKALKDDGTWLLVDIKAHDSLELNVSKNPMASLLYGISVLSCMSSAMSEDGGEGLGTLGLSAVRAESMAREAGFTHFKKLDVDHSVNAFYEVRP